MTQLASPLPDFRLEVHFSRWEFLARHNLTASDAQTMTVTELLERVASEDLIAVASDGTVEPTATGAALYLRLRQSASELTARVVRDLDPDDVQTTIAVLQSATARAEVLLGR